MEYLYIAFAVINALTFLLFAIDKRRAKCRQIRIRESTLLIFSVLGGCLGGLISMRIFRHKTQTPIFKFGMPFIMIVHIVAVVMAWRYL